MSDYTPGTFAWVTYDHPLRGVIRERAIYAEHESGVNRWVAASGHHITANYTTRIELIKVAAASENPFEKIFGLLRNPSLQQAMQLASELLSDPDKEKPRSSWQQFIDDVRDQATGATQSAPAEEAPRPAPDPNMMSEPAGAGCIVKSRMGNFYIRALDGKWYDKHGTVHSWDDIQHYNPRLVRVGFSPGTES